MLSHVVNCVSVLSNPMAHQGLLTKENSAPEFQNLQKNSMLRKTQSHPAKTQTLPKESKGKGKDNKHEQAASTSSDGGIHSRTKSVPSPIHTDCKTHTDSAAASAGSPKPKRSLFDGFKNTLRSKKHDKSSTSASSDCHTASDNHPMTSASEPSLPPVGGNAL